MHVEKVCFYFIYNCYEVDSDFLLSHNLHDLYLKNNFQRCGGLKCEYYIDDFIIYVQVISKLKCGYTPLT